MGPDGCQKCGCNIEFAIGGGCNPITGQCECLPGVIGQNCDSCPLHWVLIAEETRSIIPEWKKHFDYAEGCFPCESCVGDLMNSTSLIDQSLAPVMAEFQGRSSQNPPSLRCVARDAFSSAKSQVFLKNGQKSKKF